MRNETIIKRESGIKYKITVYASMDSYVSHTVKYKVSVSQQEKGKRTWNNVGKNMFDYQYRALSMQDRAKHDDANNLKCVTKEEIYAAKIELWNMMKPENI